MSRRTTANVQFHVSVCPPKGRNCAVLVIGDIPEIFVYKFTDTNFSTREHNLERIMVASIQRYQLNQQDQAAIEEGAEYDEFHGVPMVSGNVSREIAIQLSYFDEMRVLMVPDPDGLNIKNLYATPQPLAISSKAPLQAFQFAYMIWDLDQSKIYCIERVTVPRSFTVPSNSVGLYKIFSGKFNERAGEYVMHEPDYVPRSLDDQSSRGEDSTVVYDNPYDSDDDDDEPQLLGPVVQETRRINLPRVPNAYRRDNQSSSEDDEF